MDVLALAREIISGRRLGRQDDLSFFLTCDLDQLCRGADEIRAACGGDKVDLCSIINGRSGRCPEDCKYCAQSAHNHTDCEVYDFLPQEEILRVCKLNEQEGVDRFSIVTAGRALTGAEFDQAIQAYETMHRACKIDLCASMGFLSEEQLHRLHQAGVTSYHHNIETSRRNFPNICTTHTYDMKVETLKKVKAEGMCACSGGTTQLAVEKIIKAVGTDVMLAAGGGVHGHPDGSEAGAKSMRQAIDAAMLGIPVMEYAKDHPELARMLGHLNPDLKKNFDLMN